MPLRIGITSGRSSPTCAIARRVPCLFVSTPLRRGETDLNGELKQLPLRLKNGVQRIGALTVEPHSAAVSMVLAALQAASAEREPPSGI